jgi:hypothetical protein
MPCVGDSPARRFVREGMRTMPSTDAETGERANGTCWPGGVVEALEAEEEDAEAEFARWGEEKEEAAEWPCVGEELELVGVEPANPADSGAVGNCRCTGPGEDVRDKLVWDCVGLVSSLLLLLLLPTIVGEASDSDAAESDGNIPLASFPVIPACPAACACDVA